MLSIGNTLEGDWHTFWSQVKVSMVEKEMFVHLLGAIWMADGLPFADAWILAGDFNMTLHTEDKVGGTHTLWSRGQS